VAVSQTNVITVTDLHKSYDDVRAVNGVSFEVNQGEVFGLLVPNGAVKTTTVEILEGLNKPDNGRVSVLGLDPARDPGRLKERIGVQLQTAALYPNLSIAELISLFGSFYAKALPTADLIRQFGLEERQEGLSKELSGGQRQRLSVALAMVNDPELIFLDEPTTGLDPQARRALWDRIGELAREGRTVVMTTHYMEEAEELCDRVAIMDHGRILEQGTVNELVTGHFKERTIRFLRRPELSDEQLARLHAVTRVAQDTDETVLHTRDVPATIRDLFALADSAGATGLDVTVKRPTLEDVFLELTGRALRD
jgi:ABC-2 type transport system ATP-binding protein